MKISEEMINKIKEANDIVGVISQYTDIHKQSPQSPLWVGRCPFHKETDGSFKVNESTQSFYCYGCGAGTKDVTGGSDIIAFIQTIEEVDFTTACEILAERVGIILVLEPPNPKVELAKKEATAHNIRYYKNLWDPNNPNAVNALAYLRKRGLNDQTMKDFKLGLVPQDEIKYRTFTNIAGKIAFPLVEVGNDPIKAPTLGMSYRLPQDSPPDPKYKNDTTSPAYNKGHLLFGLNHAHKEIRNKKEGIIVECYFGTMMLHQFGIKNVVSPMGTMISEDQIRLAKKYAKKWYVLYDSDEGGRGALVNRALPKMLELGIQPWFAPLPEAEDPDEFILRIGQDAFLKWLKSNAVPLLDYYIEQSLAEYDNMIKDKQLSILRKITPLFEHIDANESKILNSRIDKRLGL